MDPISISEVLSATVQIASFIGETIQGLAILKEKLKDTDISIRMLIGQLSSIRSSIGQLHDWAEYNSNDSPKETDYLKGLNITLDGCMQLLFIRKTRLCYVVDK
jgi:hypothetical protein